MGEVMNGGVSFQRYCWCNSCNLKTSIREDVNHSDEFKRRRVMDWLPLGLTYAFLYMGRYNLKVSCL